MDRWRKVFDDPRRDEWQKPDAVVEALRLRPGMRVADLGAGTGYFEKRLSRAVGDSGKVFAVDVEPSLVAHLGDRAKREATANVVPVLATADDPRLPAASIDVVLVVDTFHHVDRRLDYFRKLGAALAPGGRIAIVEWKAGELPVGPKDRGHKIERETIVREMDAAGYSLVDEPGVLPYQVFLIFAPTRSALVPGADRGAKDGQ